MRFEIDIEVNESLPHPWQLDFHVDGSSFRNDSEGFLTGIENAFNTKEQLIGYVTQLQLESILKYSEKEGVS